MLAKNITSKELLDLHWNKEMHLSEISVFHPQSEHHAAASSKCISPPCQHILFDTFSSIPHSFFWACHRSLCTRNTGISPNEQAI